MPSKPFIPLSNTYQQDTCLRGHSRAQVARYEPYNSRLRTYNQREQDDKFNTMVRDPSELVFPIVGPEADDVNWQAEQSILPLGPREL